MRTDAATRIPPGRFSGSICHSDASDPPPIDWIIPDRIPRQQFGSFSGIGGTGKTTVELMRDVAHVSGNAWYNMDARQAGDPYRTAEDRDLILRLRLTAIAATTTPHLKYSGSGLRVLNLFGKEATIFHYNRRTQRVEPTPLYNQIYEEAGDLNRSIF